MSAIRACISAFGQGGGLHPVGDAELAQDVGDVNTGGAGG
jgi:hypothetical protein